MTELLYILGLRRITVRFPVGVIHCLYSSSISCQALDLTQFPIQWTAGDFSWGKATGA